MNYKELELKEKMAALVNKWKGKDIKQSHPDWWRRRGDRSLYLFYQKQLRKLQGKNKRGKAPDIVAVAEKIFA